MSFRSRFNPRQRIIQDGDSYTIFDESAGTIELVMPERFSEPPEAIQGEPWGWTKSGDKPRGWRLDSDYGGQNRFENPGPNDGEW